MRATGVVLAGGASRRMGRDKAMLEIAGRPLLDRVIDTAGSVCNEVIVAGRLAPGGARQPAGVRWVEDAPGTRGPLAGLAAALAIARNERCLVIACDMPFLSADFLRYLGTNHDDCDALVPMPYGVAQPLHAAYARSCLPTAASLLRLGSASMHDLLRRRRVRYIRHEQCLRLDPTATSWFNMNRPEDYDTAAYRWPRREYEPAIA